MLDEKETAVSSTSPPSPPPLPSLLRQPEYQQEQTWDSKRQSLVSVYDRFLATSNTDVDDMNTMGNSSSASLRDEQSEDSIVVSSNCGTNSDLPISLRKQSRKRNVASNEDGNGADQEGHAPTPSRTRRTKKVRFSDPGLSITTASSATPTTSRRSVSTGLTPYVRRATINTPSRRRHSAPYSTSSAVGTPHPIIVDPDMSLFNFDLEFGNVQEVQFTPLRQVLDERSKRRIRRNGLSEEMNSAQEERKEKERLKQEIEDMVEEVRNLKADMEPL